MVYHDVCHIFSKEINGFFKLTLWWTNIIIPFLEKAISTNSRNSILICCWVRNITISTKVNFLFLLIFYQSRKPYFSKIITLINTNSA